jgi:hypothetical protein
VVTGRLDDSTFEQCLELDDPRVERILLGASTGGGPAADWANYLRTCLWVGVATDDDRASLRSWGYSGPVSVCGRIGDGVSDEAVAGLAMLREAVT